MPDYLTNLKETILESGFPIELEVDDILRGHGWHTFPNHYYFDDEQGGEEKSRELDNLSLFPEDNSLEKGFDPLGVSPHLMVECKKLEQISVVIMCMNRKVILDYDF